MSVPNRFEEVMVTILLIPCVVEPKEDWKKQHLVGQFKGCGRCYFWQDVVQQKPI